MTHSYRTFVRSEVSTKSGQVHSSTRRRTPMTNKVTKAVILVSCTWVLWSHEVTQHIDGKHVAVRNFTVLDATSSKQECERLEDVRLDKMRSAPGVAVLGRSITVAHSDSFSSTHIMRCLPAGVDPAHEGMR